MPFSTPDHRQIAGIVQRTGERFKPLFHLPAVDACNAQALGAAPQLAAVLSGDNDAVGHHPDLYRHPVAESRLRYSLAVQKYRVMHGPAVVPAVGCGASVVQDSDLRPHLITGIPGMFRYITSLPCMNPECPFPKIPLCQCVS